MLLIIVMKFWKRQTLVTDSRSWVALDRGWRKSLTTKAQEETFFGVMKMLYVLG